MADEDAGQSLGDEEAGQSMGDEDARRSMDDENAGRPRQSDDSTGLGFSLPPMSLPELRLPERIRLIFLFPEPPEKVRPTTRVPVSHVLLAALVADVLDALAVALTGPSALPWGRAVAGTLLSVVFAGGLGLAYAWELLAILSGVGWLSLTPTMTLLVLARTVVSK